MKYLFDESDRELMRRTYSYQSTILSFNFKILFITILSAFILSFKKALAEVEAEKRRIEKYPEVLLGWEINN